MEALFSLVSGNESSEGSMVGTSMELPSLDLGMMIPMIIGHT